MARELELPADYETTGMAKLRREAHARMLGNWLCTRPVELDCRMEAAGETCSYFQTNVELQAHPPDASAMTPRSSGHPERTALFEQLLERLGQRGCLTRITRITPNPCSATPIFSADQPVDIK